METVKKTFEHYCSVLSLKIFNAITDKTAGHRFIYKDFKSHSETLSETTTQPRSVINNVSFNSIDNLLQPIKWVGVVGWVVTYSTVVRPP